MDDDHDDDTPRFLPPHMKDRYDLNSKIMLTAIISLSIVVVLVTVLHIYARCILRRQARRRAAIRQLGITISQIQSSEPPKTGLDPTVIAALPMFVYKQSDQTSDHEQGAVECAVCLSMLEDEEMARVLPNCNHTFHAECIDRWFGSNSTCPICRTEAEPQLRLITSEGGSGGLVSPSAPPLNSGVGNMEGTSLDGGTQSSKVVGSSSRLSSFRKMLSKERTSSEGGSGGLGKERTSSEGGSGGLVSPSAPPLNSGSGNMEGTSDGAVQQSSKVGGSSSRLSSFRKMLSRERSSKRIQSCAEEEMEDIERQ